MDTQRQTINWLEVISASETRRDRMACQIHAVDTGGQSCCAISVDGSWLTGQGRPMMFDTIDAAQRFLLMVGVEGGCHQPMALDIDCQRANQCFHLSDKGALGLCPKHPRRAPFSAANDTLYESAAYSLAHGG